MPTILYPLTVEKLRAEALPLRERIIAWRFFNANGIDTTTQDGKRVCLSGVKFSGSPQLVFWSNFFEPFMTSAATRTLQWVVEQCRERDLPPGEYLDEARFLIHNLIRTSYRDIAQTDQLLRGNGFPNSVSCRDVSQQTEQMIQHIDSLAAAIGHRAPAPTESPEPWHAFLELKPGAWGINFDLKALYRQLRRALLK